MVVRKIGHREIDEAIAQAVVDGGYGLLEMQTEVASLEQIYLRLLEGGDHADGAGALGVKEGAEPADRERSDDSAEQADAFARIDTKIDAVEERRANETDRNFFKADESHRRRVGSGWSVVEKRQRATCHQNLHATSRLDGIQPARTRRNARKQTIILPRNAAISNPQRISAEYSNLT